jgi:hypothetical protein
MSINGRWAGRIALGIGLIVALPASAGIIFGTLYRGNQPLANAQVILKCGSVLGAGQSNAQGYYRLGLIASGDCVLNVDGKEAPVSLGNDPVRRDFDVPVAGQVLMPR